MSGIESDNLLDNFDPSGVEHYTELKRVKVRTRQIEVQV